MCPPNLSDDTAVGHYPSAGLLKVTKAHEDFEISPSQNDTRASGEPWLLYPQFLSGRLVQHPDRVVAEKVSRITEVENLPEPPVKGLAQV